MGVPVGVAVGVRPALAGLRAVWDTWSLTQTQKLAHLAGAGGDSFFAFFAFPFPRLGVAGLLVLLVLTICCRPAQKKRGPEAGWFTVVAFLQPSGVHPTGLLRVRQPPSVKPSAPLSMFWYVHMKGFGVVLVQLW